MASGPRKETITQIHFCRVASFALLCLALTILFGCGQKPLSPAKINSIAQDLAAAAQSAAGAHAQISIRPEMGHFGNGKPSLVADNIFITLPDARTLSNVQQAIEQAASRHHLKRTLAPGSSGIIRFDYLLNGRRTHSIEIAVASAEGNSGRPRLAIIIDDIGSDKFAAEMLLKLPYPLTLSILPAQAHSIDIADEAYRRGDQVMLHLPMEFEGNKAKAEPVELRVGMSTAQVDDLLAEMLGEVPHVVGVNNHEGSLATTEPQLMSELMADLRQRGLFFIDSRTTAATVAFTTAKEAGVPAASRKVFLDDVETRAAILHQLNLAALDAAQDGSAIAIGHPHPATLAALKEDLPRLNSRVRLVFASSLVH